MPLVEPAATVAAMAAAAAEAEAQLTAVVYQHSAEAPAQSAHMYQNM
jgi:hypothetical protein